MKKVNLAIVGCGVMGQMHAKYALECPGIHLQAVCDVREDSARNLAQTYDISGVYTDVEALLGDDKVHGVVLALPAGFRSDMAVKAFEAGKHVLVEKPVACHTRDVDRMIEACSDELVGACCSSRYRFPQGAQIAHDLIARGVLGQLRHIHCRGVRPVGEPPAAVPPVWRVNRKLNGGGIMINWGCYDLDYLLGITGWQIKPQLVLAQTWPVAEHLSDRVAPGSDAETHAVALVSCADGIVLTIERGESTSLPVQMAWQIVGSLGSLQLEMATEEGSDDAVITHYDTTDGQGIVSKEIWRGEIDHHLLHRGPIEDFARAILTGVPPKTSLKQARIIQQITAAIFASADRKTLVQIEDMAVSV